MTMPSGVAAAGNADSVFFVGRAYSTERITTSIELTNATYAQRWYQYGGSGSGIGLAYMGVSFYSSGAFASLTPQVQGWSSGSGALVVCVQTACATSGGVYNYPMAGGYLGASGATYSSGPTGYIELSAVLVYARALTAATDIPTLQQSLAAAFNLQPQIKDVVVFDGDSITEGYQSTFLWNRARQSQAQFSKPARVFNKGYFGDTMAHRYSNYAGDIAPLYSSTAKNNILEIFAGTNDNDGTNTSCTAIYGNMTSYVAAAHATGWKVIVGTMLPRNGWSGNQITEQGACNTLIRANSAGADAIADYAADATMGVQANTTNTAYYADGTHPTSLGYGYLAIIEAAAVNGLFQ